MNCVIYQLKCCFGPYGCSCLCIGPVRQSITTRSMYSLMLVIVSVLCIITHEKSQIFFENNEFGRILNNTCIYLQAQFYCSRLFGFIAIYRIAYAFSGFHLLMAILCIKIPSSQSWRAKIHNGFWFFKWFIIFVFWSILFLLPFLENYVKVATIIGVIAALIFIVIQDISLIDCAYEFNSYLREKGAENCCYEKLVYIVTFVLYLITVSGYVILYFIFAIPNPCITNRVIIIINASASLVIILFSFFIARHNRNKLYIPGSVTCVFVVFLTWTAINSAPYEKVSHNFKPANQFETRRVIPYDEKNSIYKCQTENEMYAYASAKEVDTIVGILVLLATAVYSSIRSTTEYKRYGIKPTRSKVHMMSTSQIHMTSGDIPLHGIKSNLKDRISASLNKINEIDGKDYSKKFISSKENKRTKGNSERISASLNKINEIDEEGLSKKFISSKKNKRKRTLSNNNTVSTKENQFIKRKKSKMNDDGITLSLPENELVENLRNCPIDSFLIHDEHFFVHYSYSWLHIIFGLAYLFVMAQLTNWYSPETSNLLHFDKSLPSLWMKIAISWIALGLFGWTLLFPAFCIGRRLYEHPLDSMNRYRRQALTTKSQEKSNQFQV